MTQFESGAYRRQDRDAWVLLLAITGAIVTYSFMHMYLGTPRGGIFWVLLQYGLDAGLPLAFGLAAWYAASLRGLLIVATVCSLATGSATFMHMRETLVLFDYTAEMYATSVFISYLIAFAVGMLLPLMFTVYQLWPIGSSASDTGGDGRPLHVRRKLVDGRFGQATERLTKPTASGPAHSPWRPMSGIMLSLPGRLLAAGILGYATAQILYASQRDSGQYRALYSTDPRQLLEEFAFFLLMPLLVAVVLRAFGTGLDGFLAMAAVAAVAGAWVGASQVYELQIDSPRSWYAAHFVRLFTWFAATGVVLPWLAARFSPRGIARRTGMAAVRQ